MARIRNENRKLTDSRLFLAACSFGMALLVLMVIMLLSGYHPAECFRALFAGAFGGAGNLANTLGTSTPLIFAGLAMMLASESGTFNIGIEGQIIAGAFVSALVGVGCGGLPRPLLLPVCFASAMLAGGLAGALIAVLKRALRVSELIIAIMLNYIIDYLTQYLLTYHFTVEGMVVRTRDLPAAAQLTKLLPLSRLNTGIFIVLAVTAVCWWLLERTVFGFELRATGFNGAAAETAGIPQSVMPVAAMFLSGAVAGLAGAVEVMGVHGCFLPDMTAGYGFTGVAIGIMGGNSAPGTLVSALIFGALRAGSTTMSRMTDIPGEFIQILQALVIVFVSTPRIVKSMVSHGKKKGGHAA